MNLTMSRAASVGTPCCSVTTRRTVSLAPRSRSPRLTFFSGTLRRTSLVSTTSHSACILNSPSATRVSVASWRSKSIAAFEPLKS